MFVRKITKTDKGYYVETELAYDPLMDYSYENTLLEDLIESKLVNLNIIIDGDYLYLYTKKNKLLITYVLVDGSVSEQYINLMINDKCDLSVVNWPRHADGSCDYTGYNVKTETTSLDEILLVTENLKLRSSEDLASDVFFVMSPGTKLGILEFGKAETINDISSNWIRVVIIENTKDRDGNLIQKGTTGWCFGGYLKKAPVEEEIFYSSDSNNDNEETSIVSSRFPKEGSSENIDDVIISPTSVNQKASCMTLIIFIVAILFLLIVIIVILIVVRKKKHSK